MYYNYRPEYNYPAYSFESKPVISYGRFQDQMDYAGDIPVYHDVAQNMQTNFTEALKIIREAVAGEKEDRDFYEALLNLAGSLEDKDIISGIRQNEIKHNKMFREIYFDHTGRNLKPEMQTTGTQTVSVDTYCEGLKKALMGEQGAVEKYRKILFSMKERKHINMMTEIITDELRHLGLYNYLYAKNQCNV